MSNPTTIADCKCVPVVGATAGIGRALGLAIHALPSKPIVISAGRRQERLDQLALQGERIKTVRFDVAASRDALKAAVQSVYEQYPDLDGVIFCSGVQHIFDFRKPGEVDLDRELSRMVTYFLPRFLKLSEQGRPSLIVAVTSGLAIVPGFWIPNYSATKGALHNFTVTHRHLQLIKKTDDHSPV